MAKNDKKDNKHIGVLDNTVRKLLSVLDAGTIEREAINSKDRRIQNILNSELDVAKGVSNGRYVDFAASVMRDSPQNAGRSTDEIDTHSLFTNDIGNIFGYFQDIYKNRYIELADLKFISKFIPDIGEAVKVTLDSIVSSDDYTSSITRKIVLNGSLTDDEKGQVLAEVERLEREHKLLRNLKNIVYHKTLVSGMSYVYCIPYSELFEEYDRLLKTGKIKDNMLISNGIAGNRAPNSATKAGFNIGTPEKMQKMPKGNASIGMESNNMSIVMENVLSHFSDSDLNAKPKNMTMSNKEILQENVSKVMSNFHIYDETNVLFEALESAMELKDVGDDLKPYEKMFGESYDLSEASDATYNSKDKSVRPEKFEISGSYVKYIDASSMVPVRIHNRAIGYLYVHDTGVNQKMSNLNKGMSETTLLSSSYSVFNSTTLPEQKRENATRAIVDSITDSILMNFSNKFVKKNAEFKQIIADCIISTGMVNTEFQIQFIPANYIVPFAINPDEDGYGQSCIQDALFPAKMLLTLLVSKLLLHMNKGGDKTISYVRKGPINVDTANHTQRVIRMIQESNITFSDLLSTNLSFAKFNRNGNIQIPMAQNGDRLVDFEVQPGQEVDMKTPMEEFLLKMAMIGTPVPSNLIDFTDTSDYSRSLITSSLKLASRVASMQSDLEEPTTDLYILLLSASQLPAELVRKALSQFQFSLARPKVLSNANMTDYLSQMQSIVESVVNIYMRQDDDSPDSADVRQAFTKSLATQILPFIPWNEYEELLQSAKVSVVKDKVFESTKSNTEDTGLEDSPSSDDDMF